MTLIQLGKFIAKKLPAKSAKKRKARKVFTVTY